MITIRNKYLLAAAGFWLLGLIFVLIGAAGRSNQWDSAGTLLTIGILAQAIGFGLLGFVLMQAVFSKKK
ncbi:hypothetical protein [Spirosoma montaniterrae]|uniref:Uncharacterized protein n=1 Tax=Spirosoma montaniterrae TaxID=1178516 RepID=A0A1P9X0Q4_9BACT|nr:hypothetical protein [Spirosoma montaniterrae]AQG81165.1 hypothetical protein AWR27_18675 [Spirosoma montaniterrae]